MAKVTGRNVSELRIHQTTLLQGFGNLKNPLTTTTKVLGDTKMTIVPEGVLVQALANRTKVLAEMLIPWGNIVSAQLLPDAEAGLEVSKVEGSPLVTAKPKSN